MSDKTITHIVLNQRDYSKLKAFLQGHCIKFEPSGYGENVYVSLNVTEYERVIVDEFLSTNT